VECQYIYNIKLLRYKGNLYYCQVNTVVCGLSGSTVFCTLSHKGANFEVSDHKMCFAVHYIILKPKKDPAMLFLLAH